MNDRYGRVAGEGVDTPRALARAASRWGGRGDRGGAHPGGVLVETGERPFSVLASATIWFDMMVSVRSPLTINDGALKYGRVCSQFSCHSKWALIDPVNATAF